MTSFGTIFRSLIRSSNEPRHSFKKYECLTYHEHRCTICPAISLRYETEVKLKDRAFKEFWSKNGFPGKPESLTASPLGRRYRTNSKRRVFATREGPLLGFTELDRTGRVRPLDVIDCPIEPSDHSRVYNLVQQFIDDRSGRALGREMNYVIVKGTYKQLTVLLSLKHYTPSLNAGLNQLSKNLTREIQSVTSVFSFLDEHSRYYMSDKADISPQGLRKIFGGSEITATVTGNKLSYSPLVFSQTNASMINWMVQKASECLQPKPNEHLYDWYCGYGVFAISLAHAYKAVHGVESSADAVESAKVNASRLKISNVRFTNARLDRDTITRFPVSNETVVILDPPRNGTDQGVIEWLAQGGIKKALHLFCEIDHLPKEIERWNRSGFRPVRIIPFDMFPGTDSVETMVLLEPKA